MDISTYAGAVKGDRFYPYELVFELVVSHGHGKQGVDYFLDENDDVYMILDPN